MRARPSAALVVATAALFVSLSGTAWAAFVITSNSQVAPHTIAGANAPAGANKNLIAGSVGTPDLHPGAVAATVLGTNAVTGAKVAADTLTGADVKESTLAKVPAAAKADTVKGVKVTKIRYVKTGSQSESTILDLNGLILRASCDGQLVTLTARTTSDDAELNYISVDAGNSATDTYFNDIFTSADSIELPTSTSSHMDTQKDIRFVSAEGKQVQVWLSEEDDLGSAACVLYGYAIS